MVNVHVFRVRFTLTDKWFNPHTTYIHAASPDDAMQKLADRFPTKPKDIHIVSINEDHGKFVIGSEERQF